MLINLLMLIMQVVSHFHHSLSINSESSLFSSTSLNFSNFINTFDLSVVWFANMTKLLMIRGLEETYVDQFGLFKDIESEICKDYEIYVSESTMEAIDLLGKHHFQVVLSIPMERRRTSKAKHLHTLLAVYILTGGTLVLAAHRLNARWITDAPWRPTRPNFNGNFDLEGHYINDDDSYYALNPEIENLFGPSVFASLDTVICTNEQLVGDFPDSAKIYRSALEPGCPAAFVKHDKGYIGYLIDTPAIPALRTLLLAMLGRL